jgi:site-specific recombinase XerD
MMKTQELLTQFLKDCEERGLTPNTRRTYWTFLRHFVDEHPELPTDTRIIEAFLKKRKETPGRRGTVFKKLQAFYSYLVKAGILEKSPVPPKGLVGRPRKFKPVAADNPLPGLAGEKVVQGGRSVSRSMSISTEQAVNWFTTSRRNIGLKEGTFEVYRDVFTRFIQMYPELPLAPEPIEAFLNTIKRSYETKHKFFRTLRALYHFLEERKGIAYPMKSIHLPAPREKVRDKLTLDQMKQLFELDMKPQTRAILLLISDIGLRAGAICKLEAEDIRPGYVKLHEKTSDVEVPISKETEELLRMLSPSGLLFRTPRGPMNKMHLYRTIRRLLEQIGITRGHLGPHTLRHSFASQYLEQGGDLMSLSQILGHKRVSTTQIYARMAPEGLKKRHDQASPAKQIVNDGSLYYCRCNQCGQHFAITPGSMATSECSFCHQVGSWYLVKTITPEQLAELQEKGSSPQVIEKLSKGGAK